MDPVKGVILTGNVWAAAHNELSVICLPLVFVAFSVKSAVQTAPGFSVNRRFRWWKWAPSSVLPSADSVKRCCWWHWRVSVKSCQGLLKNRLMLTQKALLSWQPRSETLRDLTLHFHSVHFVFFFSWKTWFSFKFTILLFLHISRLSAPPQHDTCLLLRAASGLLVHSFCKCCHHHHRMAVSHFSVSQSFQDKWKWI